MLPGLTLVLSVAPAPPAQMCMDPAAFMPDKVVGYQCQSISEDPAAEADCPEECWGWSELDKVDGSIKHYCVCEASSAEGCAEQYPGGQPRLMPRMPRRPLPSA